MRTLGLGLLVCGLVAMTAAGRPTPTGTGKITVKKNATVIGPPRSPPSTVVLGGVAHTTNGYVAVPSGTYDVGIGPAAGANYPVVVQMVVILANNAGYVPVGPPPQYPYLNGVDQSAFAVLANPTPGTSLPWKTIPLGATAPNNIPYVMTYSECKPPGPGQIPRGISAALNRQGVGNNWTMLAFDVDPL